MKKYFATALAICALALSADFNVKDYGALGDGKAYDTPAIQKAIDACAEAGGGRVILPEGEYLSGSVMLKSRVELNLQKGALISGIQDESKYPMIPTRVAGIETVWPAALINAIEAKDVAITGEGTIDGNGEMWWDKYWAMRKDYDKKGLRWVVDYDCYRPRLMLIFKSTGVDITGLTLREPGFWTVHLCYSSNIYVADLTIRGNLDNKFGPSSDGIDIDSSNNVLVERCDIDCNDDNFCLKAGRDSDGLRVNRPTFNVVIRDCIARRGDGLITFGSETSGSIYNIEAYNLVGLGTDNGLRFKSTGTRGGTVRNVYLHDIDLERVSNAIKLDYNWYPAYNNVPEDVRREIEEKGDTLPPHWAKLMAVVPEEQGTPYIRDVVIENITASGSKVAVGVKALEKSPATRFTLKNIKIQADKAGSITNAAAWTFDNVTIESKDGSTLNTAAAK